MQKQYSILKDKIDKDILSVLEKGDFVLGDKVFDLENKLAKYVGAKECISCASGTDALLISLMSQGIGKGDAVFTTNFSFFATTEVISHIGASPIFLKPLDRPQAVCFRDLTPNKVAEMFNQHLLV